MTRKLVRHAVAEWLAAGQIPGLDRVDRAKVEYTIPTIRAGTPRNRCYSYLLLSRDHEARISFGGEKQIDYRAVLVLHFWSVNSDWLAVQDDLDDVIDGVKAQIRAGGHQLGRPDAILQAGEWTTGIEANPTEPISIVGGLIYSVCPITFEVPEIITNP